MTKLRTDQARLYSYRGKKVVLFILCLTVVIASAQSFHSHSAAPQNASRAPLATVRNVGPNEDLQAVLDSLSDSTVDTDVVLPVNYKYSRLLVLRNRPHNNWITIRSATTFDPNVRVSPADAAKMPKLTSDGEHAVIAADESTNTNHAGAAHHYRFIGLEVTATSHLNWNLFCFCTAKNPVLADLPHDIEIFNSYIHGNDAGGEQVRGIAINGARFTVRSNYISGFKSTFMEANAIGGTTSPGQIDIENNYLEAAGENLIFGAAEDIQNLVTDRIVIKHNYFYKPPAWRNLKPAVFVKNLLEFKEGKNIVIQGNVFENIWYQNQAGSAILFTPRIGGQPNFLNYANEVSGITFEDNIIRHAVRGISGMAWDDYLVNNGQQSHILDGTAPRSHDWRIVNNLFDDLSAAKYSIPNDHTAGIEIGGPPVHTVIEKNTFQFAREDDYWKKFGLYLDSYTVANGMVFRSNDFGANVSGDSRGGPSTVKDWNGDWDRYSEPKRRSDKYGILMQPLPIPLVWENNIVDVPTSGMPDWNTREAWRAAFRNQKFVNESGVGADVRALLAGEANIKRGVYTRTAIGAGALLSVAGVKHSR